MTKNLYNCRVRLKSTKDGKVTAIHRNNLPIKSQCDQFLDDAKKANLKQVMITGFDQHGEAFISFSDLDNFGQGLTMIDNLNNFFRAETAK